MHDDSPGFATEPTFAILTRGALRLLLSAPTGPGGGAQSMPDGRRPEPGGWNRIQIEISDLPGQVENLRKDGARFRNEIVIGIGGSQILLECGALCAAQPRTTHHILMQLLGTYQNAPIDQSIRYTRVWINAPDGSIQLIAGHSSMLQAR